MEHLLRDIKDDAVGTLSTQITWQLQSLRGLTQRVQDIVSYLDKVLASQLPINHAIIYDLQNIFNLLANVVQVSDTAASQNSIENSKDSVKAFSIKSNDQLLSVYLSSLVRSVIALHNLINNKLSNRETERLQEENEHKLAQQNLDDKKDDEKSPPLVAAADGKGAAK